MAHGRTSNDDASRLYRHAADTPPDTARRRGIGDATTITDPKAAIQIRNAEGDIPLFVFVDPKIIRQRNLLHLRRALDSLGFILRAGQSRQKQRRQNRDDRNDHQQLDKRKAVGPLLDRCVHSHILFHLVSFRNCL